ncbi:2Fe-2S iron-sulfur cluster binding domain-containing protein [Aureibaculum sp. A20]|uniref:2Fe-2S iron-sulfur cluster binding domain-containing protein n=1 Tax=Aureibaculum flavum TaxID=2795986 RepID=A0ABS0WPN8_9FLAO|nr:2Fe-2S iron-sulfur cluster-binding protein [Aureibaculum flavum]MBJ2173951.1 2Fe-2S iron-sulfur cluster binding domain-containing protein [Aureibaculum flavum]
MEENTIKVTIIDRAGETHNVDAPTDMNMNVMELVRVYELAPEGTIGICGGMAMCASCQCYIESPELELPEMSLEEEDMLDQAFHVKDNSRLGCQIYLKDELDGLIIELAPESEISE